MIQNIIFVTRVVVHNDPSRLCLCTPAAAIKNSPPGGVAIHNKTPVWAFYYFFLDFVVFFAGAFLATGFAVVAGIFLYSPYNNAIHT